MFKVNGNFENGRRSFAGVVVVVLVLSLAAISQAALFNINVSCTTLNQEQSGVLASSAVNFYVEGIDLDLANTFTYMGSSTVDYETTSGSASMDTGEFYLWSRTTVLEDNSVYAFFVIGTYDQDIIRLNTIMSEGFSFDSIADFAAFFETINTTGVYNPYAAYCIIPEPALCTAMPQNISIEVPEPATMALLGMAAFFMRQRNKKSSGCIANC